MPPRRPGRHPVRCGAELPVILNTATPYACCLRDRRRSELPASSQRMTCASGRRNRWAAAPCTIASPGKQHRQWNQNASAGQNAKKTIIDTPNANFLAKLSSKFRVLSQSHQGRSAPLLRPMPRQMLPSSQRLRTVFISVWERMYVRATGLKAEKHGVKGH